MRGLYKAMGQYSSLFVSAVVLTLGGVDIEDGVLDREQVDNEREEVETMKEVEDGEKQEKDRTRTNNAQNTHHGWHKDGMKRAPRH